MHEAINIPLRMVFFYIAPRIESEAKLNFIHLSVKIELNVTECSLRL